MSEPATSPDQSADAAERLPRCCPRHPDWATLTRHLAEEFPEVAMDDLVREVSSTKEAVAHVGMDPDAALEVGELIVRHQLMMRSGRVAEVARLDPERHSQRT